MRRTLFIGNWKANKNIFETEEFFKELQSSAAGYTAEVAICPSFVNLECASRNMPVTVQLGAQDVSQYGSGSHTGEVTAGMLSAVKVKYVIVGHADRRATGETNAVINSKLKAVLANGMTPVLCVGETLTEYNNNMTKEVIEKQIKECLAGINEHEKVVIGYVPVWAIGTGYIATPDLVNIIADFIRKTVQKMTGNAMSANFPILYGGSVTGSNAREYLETPEIDGLIIGGASMKVQSFSEIVTTKFQIKKYSE